MKITKSKLKRIIKEEISRVLYEAGVPPTALGLPNDVGTPEKLLAAIQDLLSKQKGPLNDPPETGSDYAPTGQARLIINLINKQLKKSQDDEIIFQFQTAKLQIMCRDSTLFSAELNRHARNVYNLSLSGDGDPVLAALAMKREMEKCK